MVVRIHFAKSIFFAVVIAILLTTLLISSVGIWIRYRVGDAIYPHVSVDGKNLGYLSKTEALEMLQRRDEYFGAVSLEVHFRELPIATFSGEQLGLSRDIETKVDQAYLVGRSKHLPSRIIEHYNGLLGLRKYDFYSHIRFDAGPIEEFLRIAEETYNVPAKNALFSFENGKVVEFKEHAPGVAIRADLLKTEIEKRIQTVTPDTQTLKVLLFEESIEPEITLKDANEFGIEEQIALGSSNYTGSITSRVHNLLLAASKFDGVIIRPGEEFSFNKLIGDISVGTGYQQAYVIKNGRTVLGDGGGVCQVSTTMFRAALNAGLPITERNPHAYRVSYYEQDSSAGFDASIYTPSVDLRFKNDMNTAILIRLIHDQNTRTLQFALYGKKDGRKIEISPASVWDVVPPPEPLYEDDPTLPAGQVRQVDFPAWGAKARFTYKVLNPDGSSRIDTNFFSAYRPWRAVYMRGTM